MIVTDALATGRLVALAPDCRWFSLARRGMLWSEVQVFDVLVLDPGASADVADGDYVELLYCVRGGLTMPAGTGTAAADAVELRAGQVVVLAPGGRHVAALASGTGCVLVRLRGLPRSVSEAMPVRQPALVEPGG